MAPSKRHRTIKRPIDAATGHHQMTAAKRHSQTTQPNDITRTASTFTTKINGTTKLHHHPPHGTIKFHRQTCTEKQHRQPVLTMPTRTNKAHRQRHTPAILNNNLHWQPKQQSQKQSNDNIVAYNQHHKAYGCQRNATTRTSNLTATLSLPPQQCGSASRSTVSISPSTRFDSSWHSLLKQLIVSLDDFLFLGNSFDRCC